MQTRRSPQQQHQHQNGTVSASATTGIEQEFSRWIRDETNALRDVWPKDWNSKDLPHLRIRVSEIIASLHSEHTNVRRSAIRYLLFLTYLPKLWPITMDMMPDLSAVRVLVLHHSSHSAAATAGTSSSSQTTAEQPSIEQLTAMAVLERLLTLSQKFHEELRGDGQLVTVLTRFVSEASRIESMKLSEANMIGANGTTVASSQSSQVASSASDQIFEQRKERGLRALHILMRCLNGTTVADLMFNQNGFNAVGFMPLMAEVMRADTLTCESALTLTAYFLYARGSHNADDRFQRRIIALNIHKMIFNYLIEHRDFSSDSCDAIATLVNSLACCPDALIHGGLGKLALVGIKQPDAEVKHVALSALASCMIEAQEESLQSLWSIEPLRLAIVRLVKSAPDSKVSVLAANCLSLWSRSNSLAIRSSFGEIIDTLVKRYSNTIRDERVLEELNTTEQIDLFACVAQLALSLEVSIPYFRKEILKSSQRHVSGSNSDPSLLEDTLLDMLHDLSASPFLRLDRARVDLLRSLSELIYILMRECLSESEREEMIRRRRDAFLPFMMTCANEMFTPHELSAMVQEVLDKQCGYCHMMLSMKRIRCPYCNAISYCSDKCRCADVTRHKATAHNCECARLALELSHIEQRREQLRYQEESTS